MGVSPACEVIPEPLRLRNYDVILAPHTNLYSFRMDFADRNVYDAWDPAIEIRLKGSQMQMVIGDWNARNHRRFAPAWITFFGFAQAIYDRFGCIRRIPRGRQRLYILSRAAAR